MNNRWTVIYPFHDKKLHLEHLKKSNPEAVILYCDISNFGPKQFVWRNNDLFIRNWIKSNLELINTNNILISEWDTLITKPLPDIHLNGIRVQNIARPYEKHKKWYWFRDKFKLGRFEPYACGLGFFGLFMLNKETLLAWLDQEFDFLYDQDIFCELRLGTIFNYLNINMESIPYKYIGCDPKIITDTSEPDYYHPVKYQIK